MPNGKPRIKKLLELAADPAIDLWALDEVHFQQHGSRCRMWVPPELKKPICKYHPTRQSVGYFGAVSLRDGRFVRQREDLRFDGQTFGNFLLLLEQESRRLGQRVVVISDNARYHHARLHADWRAQHQASFQLDFLPPYSPELNPIERVWKLTRRCCLHNEYFAQLQGVITAVEGQFDRWSHPNETLRRLCGLV